MSIPDSEPGPITFTDTDIEGAAVIRIFLNLCEGSFDYSIDATLLPTIRFLKKYDCQREIKVLSAHMLAKWKVKGVDEQMLFVVAAHLKQIELCKELVSQWNSLSHSYSHSYAGSGTLDRVLRYRNFKLLPEPYAYAFLEAVWENVTGKNLHAAFDSAVEKILVRTYLYTYYCNCYWLADSSSRVILSPCSVSEHARVSRRYQAPAAEHDRARNTMRNFTEQPTLLPTKHETIRERTTANLLVPILLRTRIR